MLEQEVRMPVLRSAVAAFSLLLLLATIAKGDPIGSGGSGNSLGNLLYGATLTAGTSGGFGGFTLNSPTATFSEPPTVASTAPVAAAIAAPVTTPTMPVADGFINFGAGPYPDASSLATGTPLPWYTSPKVDALFGGTPTPAQQAAFTTTVLQLAEQTFQLSGVNVNLTTNPGVSAAHTLSVISGSSSIPFPNSIGTTLIGGSGFSFIDQEAQISSSVGQLEQIVAHNLAHELMLAFGVPEQYDQTGNYIDATTAKWAMMLNPSATFSPSAALAINQALQAANSSAVGEATYAQYAGPQVVPEPTTLAPWGLGLVALVAGPRFRGKRRLAA